MVFGTANLFVAPLYPVFQVRVLHLTYSQVAVISLVWSVAWLIAYRVWGWVADRLRPAVVLIASVLGYALASLIYSRAHSLGSLLLAATLIGQADAGMDLGWLAEVMRLAGDRTSTYFGLHLTLMGLRGTIAPFIGTSLLSVFPIRRLFVVGGLVILIGLIPFIIAERVSAAASSRSVEREIGSI